MSSDILSVVGRKDRSNAIFGNDSKRSSLEKQLEPRGHYFMISRNTFARPLAIKLPASFRYRCRALAIPNSNGRLLFMRGRRDLLTEVNKNNRPDRMTKPARLTVSRSKDGGVCRSICGTVSGRTTAI